MNGLELVESRMFADDRDDLLIGEVVLEDGEHLEYLKVFWSPESTPCLGTSSCLSVSIEL